MNMKKIALILALLLLFPMLAGCGKTQSAPVTDPADSGNEITETAAPGGDAENPAATAEGRVRLPDFTVETADGGTFTLSEALKDRDMVLINLWATWCGYCTMEFPYLQEAYEEYKDDVAVIALSVEENDTLEVIADYAEENGLSFPFGRVGDTGLDSYADDGVPVSIIVDRNGDVISVELGAKSSTQDFVELFRSFTAEDYKAPEKCVFELFFINTEGVPVPDCEVTFCTDELCVPVKADENGVAVFEGEPREYHVSLIAPQGIRLAEGDELIVSPYDQTIYVYVEEDAQ